jgi:hypothetical protein
MAKLNLTRAAAVAGISRRSLRRAIDAGRLHRNDDGTVDTEALERAGYPVQMALLPQERDIGRGPRARVRPAREAPGAPGKTAPGQAGLLASATVQLELSGHQVQLTLRDTDEGRLLTRLQAVLEPFPPAATPAVATPSQSKRQESIRDRIFGLLRQHPSGLKGRDIAKALRQPKLSDTLVGMVRYGHLIRVAKGTYAMPPDCSPRT